MVACFVCSLYRLNNCDVNCMFRDAFPDENFDDFVIVQNFTSLTGLTLILQPLNPIQRREAARSLLYEANTRIMNPVEGCPGIINRLVNDNLELNYQYRNQLALFQQLSIDYVEMRNKNQELETQKQNLTIYNQALQDQKRDLVDEKVLLEIEIRDLKNALEAKNTVSGSASNFDPAVFNAPLPENMVIDDPPLPRNKIRKLEHIASGSGVHPDDGQIQEKQKEIQEDSDDMKQNIGSRTGKEKVGQKAENEDEKGNNEEFQEKSGEELEEGKQESEDKSKKENQKESEDKAQEETGEFQEEGEKGNLD